MFFLTLACEFRLTLTGVLFHRQCINTLTIVLEVKITCESLEKVPLARPGPVFQYSVAEFLLHFSSW